MHLAGRTVLLTGATGGIGQALARTFAGEGARLVLTGRRRELLEGLEQELGAEVVACDLSDADEVRKLIEAQIDADVLVANAALPASGTLDSFSEEQIDRALDVNLRVPILTAHAMAPRMVARGSGHLVFVSSLSGKAATAGSSIYNATKFGLRGFASALRAELHGSGVGVSAVFPGFIRDAGMFAESGTKLPPGVGTKTPQEVADATLRAIERDQGEVDVAPLPLRFATTVAAVAPELSARVTRAMGGADLTTQIADGQSTKR